MCLKFLYNFAIILLISIISLPVIAQESLEKALTEGTPYLNMRYRYEFADQASRPHNAHASTLRSVLGYKTEKYYDVSALLEFENITQLGNDNYNDTLNGRTDHPVVADVESTEVNQAYLQYDGINDTNIRVGRQEIILDNHRFIGNVLWRQNFQSYDAAKITNNTITDTQLTYAYVANANRIFGNDSPVGRWDMDSHIMHATNNSLPIGTVNAYGYLLDIDDALATSSKTFGISVVGKQALDEEWRIQYRAEYAHQSDYGDNPIAYNADYYHIAPAIGWNKLTVTAGYEVLGSDNGAIGFSTPLATLHKFNGWADKFLATPAAGLEDAYLDITYAFGATDNIVTNGLLLKMQYHDFSANEGNSDYGQEIGAFVKKKINDHYYVEAKFADYDADIFSDDIQRFTLGIGLTY